MRKPSPAIGSAVFFVVAPGTVAGLIPWFLTGWHASEPMPHWVVAQAVGIVLIGAGLVPLVLAFAAFAQAGGTPMPTAPTQQLVVRGFNRYVRNPMYAGLLAIILGQALLFARISLVCYAVAVWAVTASFVRWYEEPALTRQFGAEYEAYRCAVPAWWPRLRPWMPGPPGPAASAR